MQIRTKIQNTIEELYTHFFNILFKVYKDCYRQAITSPYLCHRTNGSIHGLQFCPYEDVMGVGHEAGFTSLLIPGK